jgi:hypothetical protein
MTGWKPEVTMRYESISPQTLLKSKMSAPPKWRLSLGWKIFIAVNAVLGGIAGGWIGWLVSH